jgi:hypothetical protein
LTYFYRSFTQRFRWQWLTIEKQTGSSPPNKTTTINRMNEEEQIAMKRRNKIKRRKIKPNGQSNRKKSSIHPNN